MQPSVRPIRRIVLLVPFAGLILQGCGQTPAASPGTPTPQATIAAILPTSPTRPPHAEEPTTPTAGSLTWEEGTRTVTIHPLSADSNLIVLGFTVEDKSLPPVTRGQLVWGAAPPISLTTLDGTQLPAEESEIGWQWNPNAGAGGDTDTGTPSNIGDAGSGSKQPALLGTSAAFDATPLSTTSTSLQLRVVTDLTPRPSGPSSNPRTGPPGSAPSPQPTEPLPAGALNPIHVDRIITIPFDPLRRIAEPHLSVEGRGVTLTLDRVQVTASEVRLYITGGMPQAVPGGGPQLSGDGPGDEGGAVGGGNDSNSSSNSSNSWSLSSNMGGFRYAMSERVGNNGQWVYRIGVSLLDKPGPWVLTLPAVTEMVQPGSAQEHGPWRGPWRFRFSLPAPEASLTPGITPTLSPATPGPTDVPGAEPTFVGPLRGPVPPTATP